MDKEIEEALAMIGGYEHPSIEIVPAHSVIERRAGEFSEREVPSFVKISTNFKDEMGKVDEIALKVWLFIALSVNRVTNRANPGVRTIAAGCNLDKDTVTRAVKRLEEYGLLIVDRDSKKYNIYQPTGYVSANKSVPTEGTIEESVPAEAESVPTKPESVPSRGGLNQSNQSNHNTSAEIEKIVTGANKTVDAILQSERVSIGRTWTNLPPFLHPYGQAFCEATGIVYHKRDANTWIDIMGQWLNDGFSPEWVKPAVLRCIEGGTSIAHPRSITWALNAIRAEQHNRVETHPQRDPILDEDTSQYVPAPGRPKKGCA